VAVYVLRRDGGVRENIGVSVKCVDTSDADQWVTLTP
jgi:hypothetical protein